MQVAVGLNDGSASKQELDKKFRPLTGSHGLAAAVYTQTNDVEIEVNGLMSYDREIVKMHKETIATANRELYLPPPAPPVIKVLTPSSKGKGLDWRYTTSRPSEA